MQLRRQEVAAGLRASFLERHFGHLGIGQVRGQRVEPPDAVDIRHRLDVKSENRGQSPISFSVLPARPEIGL
jgi:hypothetical protein